LDRAAVRDLTDPGDIIEIEIPLLVEGGIAHWSRGGRRSDARRHWIVDVKVLSATLFPLTSNSSTTMPRENKVHPVRVVLEHIITQAILVFMGTLGMAIHRGIITAIVA
jgi:hypothetical protein